MTARVLEFEEWSRLPEYMDEVLKTLRPSTSRMCVVENEQGDIVARWLLYPALLAEDLWIDPRYRGKVSVGRKLWRLMHRAAAGLGFARVVSAVVDKELMPLVAHPKLGAEALPLMVTFPVRGV